MFYTDELERFKPLAWVVLTCLGFWAFTFWNFPRWSFIILAAITGIGLALALGEILNRRTRNRRAEREIDETIRRKRIQDELNYPIPRTDGEHHKRQKERLNRAGRRS